MSYELRANSKVAPDVHPVLRTVACDNPNSQHTTQNSKLETHNSKLGFTLIELMISIVLALLLMLGIDKVFQMTANIVGAGQSISTMARDARAAQVTMEDDFKGADSDSPVFMILSERVSAFLTKKDKLGDLDGDPMTMDGNANGTENDPGSFNTGMGDVLSPAIYGDRNHRVDRIAFFARGDFASQTPSSNSSFTSPITSNEAYIWYGHVRLPGKTNISTNYPDGSSSSYQSPYTINTTPQFPHLGYKGVLNVTPSDYDTHYGYYENNPIATNWVLGREAILLRDESNFNVSGAQYYANEHLIALPSTISLLSPLGYNTMASRYVASGTPAAQLASDYYPLPLSYPLNGFIYRSRYDVAGTTISGFRDIVTAAYNNNLAGTSSPVWWWPLAYDMAHPSATTSSGTEPVLPFRYECDPSITKPMTGTGMAQTVPYFMPHVTQFIVEYAGDYITQDPTTGDFVTPTGSISGAAVPDGQVDFYTTSYTVGATTYYRKHIRWYGFPRDTGGANGVPDGMIRTFGAPAVGTLAAIPSVTSPTPGSINQVVDVVPLRDVLEAASHGSTSPVVCAPFEQDMGGLFSPGTPPLPIPAGGDYAAIGSISANAHYYCVWRNGAPKLVRILMKIDDPTGQANGRWVEQVFKIQ